MRASQCECRCLVVVGSLWMDAVRGWNEGGDKPGYGLECRFLFFRSQDLARLSEPCLPSIPSNPHLDQRFGLLPTLFHPPVSLSLSLCISLPSLANTPGWHYIAAKSLASFFSALSALDNPLGVFGILPHAWSLLAFYHIPPKLNMSWSVEHKSTYSLTHWNISRHPHLVLQSSVSLQRESLYFSSTSLTNTVSTPKRLQLFSRLCRRV